jgi:tetratricopeptide (TPR) repeat protein
LQVTARPAESAGLYKQAIQAAPDNLMAVNNLAWVMCEQLGQYQQALELAQKGLNMSPQYIDLIDTCGVIYFRLGQINKAAELFTRCIELYPATSPAGVGCRFHLARAYAALGQKVQALEHLKQAIELNSKIGGLSTTELSEALLLLRKLQEAK